ncbi:MAG: hypothetical protein FJ303_02805 [Planctomycetes bacterium]|nr:hypothetical protein [Planctomycetota bacterium]
MVFVRDALPEKTTHVSDDDLLRRIADADRRALSHGLRTERGITLFASLAIMVGPEFDELPEMRRYLSLPKPDADTRIELFVRVLTARKKQEEEEDLISKLSDMANRVVGIVIAIVLSPFVLCSVGAIGMAGAMGGGAVAGEAAAGLGLLGPVGWGILITAVVVVGAGVIYNEMKKVDEKADSVPKTDTTTETQECPSGPDPNKEKKIKSLEKRLEEHQKKLEEFKKNPDAFDNKDFLKNAPSPDVRQRIIDGRIRHLENEIKNFQNQIDNLKGC